ncbi:transposase family Tnp2 protein [Rhizoctonia solani 123E]|uniref:Transposase family Tnp2 protein n=1 Tax=Rhizoctonia solani 123E TaxID=1423351 RepID=A0A074RM33_9AGAM|nr:transposase family Tnp2 protein [Rhizoctonia solani 123E]
MMRTHQLLEDRAYKTIAHYRCIPAKIFLALRDQVALQLRHHLQSHVALPTVCLFRQFITAPAHPPSVPSTPKSAPNPSGYHYCSPQDPALSQSTLHNPYDQGHRNNGDLYSDLLGSDPPPPPPPPLGSQPSNEEDDEEDNMDPFQLDNPDHLDPPDDDPGPDQGDMGEDEPIFQPFDDPPDPPAPDDPENEDERPAFAEHPDLRNFYIRTFILSAFKGVTEDAIAEILLSHKAALLAQDSRGELAPELSQGLAHFPLTLRSLRHRLGMNVDRFIRVYALCPACGTRYSMEEINNMAGTECPKEWDGEPCGAGLYVESILYGGVRKRSPCKSYPYIPFPDALERFLLRPGVFEWIQSWRRQGHPEDEPAEVPPTTRRVWMLNMPVDQMFGDISQGWAYRAIPCGLGRHYNAQTGTYEDIPTGDGHPLAIVMLPGGVTGIVNFDGFQVVRNGKYSVNGVYIMISTLPFHLRIKPENMILVAVMPGPKEPSKYEFDQIMQPFIDDLIELGQGVNMQVHNMATGRPEERLIHFSLSSMVVDSIARIKGCGHAGVKSEDHFCLYCEMKQAYLSDPEGFQPEGFTARNPMEYLHSKSLWLHAETEAQKNRLFKANGTQFTVFDQLPGWHPTLSSPLDGMHLFFLGVIPWMYRSLLINPGMFGPWNNRPELETPAERFDAILVRTYLPSHCGRLPPKLAHMGSNMKAEQWHHLAPISPILLFDSWRVGDTIPDEDIPTGPENSTASKDRARTAKLLLRQRRKVHEYRHGAAVDRPKLDQCLSSRSPKYYLVNFVRLALALRSIFCHEITRNSVAFGQRLLSRMCISLVEMNVYLSPSFHWMMHFESFVLKFGSPYNFWTYPFERANGLLTRINKNGHGLGELETTMARGWYKRIACTALVQQLQDIPNPSDDDKLTTERLLKAIGGGFEGERQRGMLQAVLAREARFLGQEHIQLAKNGISVNLMEAQYLEDYARLVAYCMVQLPGVIVYGDGRELAGGVHFAPNGTVKSFSHVFVLGMRYGADFHHRGKRSRYGYIQGRIPVLIKRIYTIQLVTLDDIEHRFTCAVVQRFCAPQVIPVFPWDLWQRHLAYDAWEYNQLDPPEVISVQDFSGVFALTDIEFTYGHYWITAAMDRVSVGFINPVILTLPNQDKPEPYDP